MSCLAEDKICDLAPVQENIPLPQLTLCNEKGYCSDSRPVEGSSGTEELPAFFSLAALAEVAAMENMHRYVGSVQCQSPGCSNPKDCVAQHFIKCNV